MDIDLGQHRLRKLLLSAHYTATILYKKFENYTFKIAATFPEANQLTYCGFVTP